MISHPRVKPKYHLEEVEGDGVFLLAENERHVLEGGSFEKILPLINGQRNWEEIISASVAANAIDRDAAIEACNVLINHGHVEQADAVIPAELSIFWSEFGRDSASVLKLLNSCNIHVHAPDGADTRLLIDSMRAFGYRQDPHAPPGLIIVVVNDYQEPAISEINKLAMANGLPWMLIKPTGLLPLVGPFFMPGRTACWQCLESRLSHNREVESYIMRRKNLKHPFPTNRANIPLAQMQAISLGLLQLGRWLATGENLTLESRIAAINILTGEQHFHLVTKRPQCACCGNPELSLKAGKPLDFKVQKLTAQGENGFRAEPPETTFMRYAQHISDISGVVKHVLPAPYSGDGPIRTYTAGHNFALKNDGLYFIKDGLRSASSGKGKTDSQARTSALCEALERYSGLYRGEETTIISSLNKLAGDAVDPRTVTLFSAQQYQDREAWLKRGERFQIVPFEFNPDADISWSPLWSVTEHRTKWLPSSLLYYGFSDLNGQFYFWGDSNGCAGGSTVEDATLQGFLELVERDAVAIWWYNRIQRPQVDLATLEDPYIEQMREYYSRHHREFWVLDLTADLGIPVFAAVNRRTDGEAEDIVIGFGAHLDARVGIMRALTEMNQFIPALLSKNPDGTTRYGYDDPASVNWWKTAKLAEQLYLQPLEGQILKLEDLPSAATGDVIEHLNTCFRVVEEQGMEVLVLDQTRPDIGLPVVKVIVPGMRHFWARFAPGRLYEVPVRLGWLSEPKEQADLNPIPMFV